MLFAAAVVSEILTHEAGFDSSSERDEGDVWMVENAWGVDPGNYAIANVGGRVKLL